MAENETTAAPATTEESTVLGTDNGNEDVTSDNSSVTIEEGATVAPTGTVVPDKFLKEDGTPDFDKLAKSYTELESTLRKTRPTAPKSIDEYQLEGIDLELDEELTVAFKSEALEAGLSTDQYKWVMDKYAGLVQDSMPSKEKAQEALTEAWGKEFDTNLQAARSAWDVYGKDMDINVVGNNPDVLKILARIGAELKEDNASRQPASNDPGMTQSDLDALMSSDDYWTNPEKQAKAAAYHARRR